MAQAELGPRVDEDEDEDDEQGSDLLKWAAVLAAGVLLGAGAIKVAPSIISWCRNHRTRTEGPSSTDGADVEVADPGDVVVSSPVSSAGFESEVEVALDEHRQDMSSAEAQRRVFAILIAAAFTASQLRELANARIVDDASTELQGAMDKLTTQQLTDSLNRVLEADASVLDEETTASLMETFGGGQVVEGQFVPLRNEKIKDALRLPSLE